MLDELLDLPFLAVLIAANGTPVLAARALGSRWATPIDFGLTLHDGRPLFGAHKSWRGLACGAAAAAIVGAISHLGVVEGAACGMLSLYGDLLSSFVKRRLALPPGRHVPGLDHVPEAVVPLAAFVPADAAAWAPLLLSCALFVVLATLIDASFPHRAARAS